MFFFKLCVIAKDNFFEFSIGTRVPYFPFFKISDGPLLQSVDTTGRP